MNKKDLALPSLVLALTIPRNLILTILGVASSVLLKAEGEAQALPPRDKDVVALGQESPRRGINVFSLEEREALFYFINEDAIRKFRLIAQHLLIQAKESKQPSDVIDFSDTRFWVKGLKGLMEKNMRSPWLKKLPGFFQQQLKIQYDELVKLDQMPAGQIPVAIIKQLFDDCYDSHRPEYVKELAKYGFDSSKRLYGRYLLCNASMSVEAASIVNSKFPSEEDINYWMYYLCLELAKMLEQRLEETKDDIPNAP